MLRGSATRQKSSDVPDVAIEDHTKGRWLAEGRLDDDPVVGLIERVHRTDVAQMRPTGSIDSSVPHASGIVRPRASSRRTPPSAIQSGSDPPTPLRRSYWCFGVVEDLPEAPTICRGSTAWALVPSPHATEPRCRPPHLAVRGHGRAGTNQNSDVSRTDIHLPDIVSMWDPRSHSTQSSGSASQPMTAKPLADSLIDMLGVSITTVSGELRTGRLPRT